MYVTMMMTDQIPLELPPLLNGEVAMMPHLVNGEAAQQVGDSGGLCGKQPTVWFTWGCRGLCFFNFVVVCVYMASVLLG